MDGFKIICLVGEGSFGRVFKAKRRDIKDIVALKIIRKCGRTQKELVNLRRECQIQKPLQHRNIIQMINSFETETEIVVVTEFCKRDLHYILSKQTYLSEEVALPIVCDLVAALHYLHSERVLHRDLKPQNVLITEQGVAKLCDFGFARSMSRGTHVLTSIKGTPLYMAPELIAERPYDQNADLWSLGCIVYEMVVGMPPFTTNSILELVRMIRFQSVTWPPYLSDTCRDFLQGLLIKDPSKRLSWPHLIDHPFLQNKVSSSIASGISLPLTKELTTSQAIAKENQKHNLSCKLDSDQFVSQKIQQLADERREPESIDPCHRENEGVALRGISTFDLDTLEQKLTQLKMVAQSNGTDAALCIPPDDRNSENTDEESARATTPLEAEEWLAFLQQSMQEVMRGDTESITEKSFVTMVTNALTNHGAACKISEYIACLLALPFVSPDVTKTELSIITSVYMELKVVSSLMYALRLLTNGAGSSGSRDIVTEASRLSSDQLVALERILVLVNQLVHWDPVFLIHFCDVVALLRLAPTLHLLLSLHRLRPRIATDLVAILTHILRQMPENANIVEETILHNLSSDLDWQELMTFACKTLQTRVCMLLQLMSQYSIQTLQHIWTDKLKEYIEILSYDSMQNLRCAAESLIEAIHEYPFYNNEETAESDNDSSFEKS